MISWDYGIILKPLGEGRTFNIAELPSWSHIKKPYRLPMIKAKHAVEAGHFRKGTGFDIR